MKKLVLLTLLISTIFTSCSSDDDNNGITEANLIGKWQHTNSIENGEEAILDECDLMDTIEFKANNVITTMTFYTNIVVENSQTTTTCKEDSSETGKWSLSGEIVTNVFENEPYTGKVLELTNTTLKIEYTDEYKDQEGNTVTDTHIDTYKRI
ncbi:lipocalin family protein [Aquimarina muelleri]|uniref:lipocalin family protein n=1 Tax=Aquimarina muelleri TaxID=279356 RepID=UPI003F68796E